MIFFLNRIAYLAKYLGFKGSNGRVALHQNICVFVAHGTDLKVWIPKIITFLPSVIRKLVKISLKTRQNHAAHVSLADGS